LFGSLNWPAATLALHILTLFVISMLMACMSFTSSEAPIAQEKPSIINAKPWDVTSRLPRLSVERREYSSHSEFIIATGKAEKRMLHILGELKGF